jgi:hypothetical protein
METEKMKLAEAQNYVRNTKYIVWNEDESRKLQEKLFEIGCEWAKGEGVHNTEYPFLFVNDKMKITFAPKEACQTFDESEHFSMLVDNVLCIEIEQERPKFDPKTLKPFDKVLVRDNVNNVWKARFFDRYFCKQFLTTDGLEYNYCIPYNDETKYLHGEIDEAPEFYKQD